MQLHAHAIVEVGKKYDDEIAKMKAYWESIGGDEEKFDLFEEKLSSYFGLLRDSVEAEVDLRHRRYMTARRLVATSLLVLLVYIFFLVLPSLSLIVAGWCE